MESPEPKVVRAWLEVREQKVNQFASGFRLVGEEAVLSFKAKDCEPELEAIALGRDYLSYQGAVEMGLAEIRAKGEAPIPLRDRAGYRCAIPDRVELDEIRFSLNALDDKFLSLKKKDTLAERKLYLTKAAWWEIDKQQICPVQLASESEFAYSNPNQICLVWDKSSAERVAVSRNLWRKTVYLRAPLRRDRAIALLSAPLKEVKLRAIRHNGTIHTLNIYKGEPVRVAQTHPGAIAIKLVKCKQIHSEPLLIAS